MAIPYLQSIIAGLFISLSGSLPLGNLNIAAMQIAAKENLRKALWFALGVTIIEMAYLRLTLVLIDGLTMHTRIFLVFRIVSILVLLAMAAGSFIAAGSSAGKNIILDNKIKRLVLGASMSAVNPLQIPFWMGWIVYLLSQSLLTTTSVGQNIFTFSAGIGTFIALLVFIFAGRKFAPVMQANQRIVNRIMGSLFALMALSQIIKLF